MVILGIYLNSGDKKEIRNLAFPQWFPFGNIQNIHDILQRKNINELENFKKTIISNQTFTNDIYNSFASNNKSTFNLNISCIVGKNGSGKSSLLSLYYRIINNFNCKINELFPDLNEHKTVWAEGFEATLYYQLKDKIYCIEVCENTGPYSKLPDILPVKFFDENGNNLFSDYLNDSQFTFFEKLRETFFYTISENYSIYPTTFTCFSDDSSFYNEEWEYKLYHKNDGYLTPIVLVPFKDENIIDIGKESKLAAERVSTLSMQLQLNKSSLIENYKPEKIEYRLNYHENYQYELKEKLLNSYKYYWISKNPNENTLEYINKKNFHFQQISELIDIIYLETRKNWEEILDFSNKKNDKQQDIDLINKKKILKDKLLDYISYKTIKAIFNYQYYWKEYFNNSCLYEFFLEEDNKKISKTKLKEIILIEFNTTKKINHMNLKIAQCLFFINNKNFPYNACKQDYISLTSFQKVLSDKTKKYSYDEVFLNMVPSIYDTDITYTKRVEENGKIKEYPGIKLSEMSSGEQQKLFTLSYFIYHIKNIETITGKDRTTYENISIIIDEAELYYHPDLQREYLSELIKILKRSQLSTIKNINILIATHSPFILSDIPSFNIIGLENGESKIFEDPTLGANIYDLFKNQFFMKSSIGKNSSQLFNEIINDYYKYRKKNENNNIREVSKYSNKIKTYETFIRNIGDEYYQRMIGKMIFRMCGLSEEEIYRELKKLCEK